MALSSSERSALFRDNLALQIVEALQVHSGPFTAIRLAELLGTGREHVSAALQRIKASALAARLVEREQVRFMKGRRVKFYSWKPDDNSDPGARTAPNGA